MGKKRMGNNVSATNIDSNIDKLKEARMEEIKTHDPQRYTSSTNLGLDPVTLETTESAQEKSLKNPKFDSDSKYIKGLNSPASTLRFMKKVSSLKNQQRQSEIDTLKNKYNNITNAIKMYQQDEKQIWLNFNIAKDGSYMKKRQAFLINQKINRLRKQRDTVMKQLKTKYDNSTLLQDKTNQLDLRNKYIIKNQDNDLLKSAKQISEIDSDITTKRRQSQINTYLINESFNRIIIYRVLLVGVLLSIIPLILAYSGIEHFNTVH